jgi:hypothetical protein
LNPENKNFFFGTNDQMVAMIQILDGKVLWMWHSRPNS